jgi:hypothetical protein
VFRGRYFSRAVLSHEYLLRVVRYIHRNPLALLDIGRLETYRWSSLRTYLGYRRPPVWLCTDLVSQTTGGVEGMRSLVGSSASAPATLGEPELTCAVDLLIDEHFDGQHPQGAARTVKALLLDRLPPDASDELCADLAFPTPAAKRAARSRARRRVREVPAFEQIFEGVLDIVA